MWLARFLKALPAIQQDYPKARWLFLTLTIANPEMVDLRSTLTHMRESWKRLGQRKEFPAIGFIRATEVTKGKDGNPHPHFHCILMVKPSYFQGKYYLSHEDWVGLWKSCLQVDYAPTVHIKAVTANRKKGTDGIRSAIRDVFKYSTKPDDLIGNGTEPDKQWLVQLTTQIHKTRAMALGGAIRKYMSEAEFQGELTEHETEDLCEEVARLLFGFDYRSERYVKTDES